MLMNDQFFNVLFVTVSVALNFQTPDDHLQVYISRFLDNGGCGYLLKPPCLLQGSRLVQACSLSG